jgi:TPR repeat protein
MEKKIFFLSTIKSFLLYLLAKYHIVLSLTFDNLSDKKSSFRHLRKAAELGNSWAQNDLGSCYTLGDKVSKNDVEATRWFQEAAIQENPWGQANLGTAYHEGRGVEQSFELAIFWYKKAAIQNHPEVQYNLALMYFDGIGIEKNSEEAIKYLNKSFKLGVPEANEALYKIKNELHTNESLNLPHLSISDYA